MNDELTPTRQPRVRRLAVIGAVVAATIGVVAFGASLASGGQPAPAGFAVPLVSSATPTPGTAGPGGPHGDAGWAGPRGGRMGFGPVAGGITITAINGSQLSLKTADGWTRTIDASGASVTQAGQTVPLSTLKVGDQITFRQTRQSNGTYRIDTIAVVLPRIDGTVTAVTDAGVTVRQPDGTSKTVTLTASTTYRLGNQAATKAALVDGVRVDIQGAVASDGTFTASAVEIEPASVVGTVKARSADTITVQDRAGTSVVVNVTSSTTYQVAGVGNPTLANVAVGDTIQAQGTMNPDGSLTATLVRAGAAGRFGPGFRGPGGIGPMPGGGMRGWGSGTAPAYPGTAPVNPGTAPASPGGSTSGA